VESVNNPFPAPMSRESATMSVIPGKLSIGSDIGLTGAGSTVIAGVIRAFWCGCVRKGHHHPCDSILYGELVLD